MPPEQQKAAPEQHSSCAGVSQFVAYALGKFHFDFAYALGKFMSGFAYVLGKFYFDFAYVLGKFYFDFAYVLGKFYFGFAYVLGSKLVDGRWRLIDGWQITLTEQLSISSQLPDL